MSIALPKIPVSEYPKRWDAVKGFMERENLDIMIFYADDHATHGPVWSRWLANFIVHFEPICILFTKTSDPVLMVGPESLGYANMHSQIKSVRVLQEFMNPDEDHIHIKTESLSEIVSGAVKPSSCKRMGIAGADMIPYSLLDSFKKVLPGEWVSVDRQANALRAVKTPSELDVIRYAYKIAEAGLMTAIKAIQPGVPERHVAAEAEYVMRKMGAEGYGIDTMVSSGENSLPVLGRTTLREIGKDDLVLLTFAPRYEGYHAAFGIPVLVGNPPDVAKRAIEAAICAQKKCASLLRDGQDSTPEGEARKIMDAAGFGEGFHYSGIHSIGVSEFEAPIFGPTSTYTMKENMVLSIDVPVFDYDWGGIRIEDGYIIGKTGAERLGGFEYYQHK